MKNLFLTEVYQLLSKDHLQQNVSEGCYQLLKRTAVLHEQTLNKFFYENNNLTTITSVFLKKRKNIIYTLCQLRLSDTEKHIVLNFFESSEKIFTKHLAPLFDKKDSTLSTAFKWQKVINSYSEVYQNS